MRQVIRLEQWLRVRGRRVLTAVARRRCALVDEVVFIRKYDTIFEDMHYLKKGWFGSPAG